MSHVRSPEIGHLPPQHRLNSHALRCNVKVKAHSITRVDVLCPACIYVLGGEGGFIM